MDYLEAEFLEAEADLKEIEAKLEVGNYIHYEKSDDEAEEIPVNTQSLGIKHIEIHKKQLNKDNRVLALEQMMKKNFTQGSTKKKVVQI